MGVTKDSVRSSHREALDATIASLRISGLWISDDASMIERLYGLYNKSIIITVCIFAGTVLTDLCLNYDDLIVLTDDGCILAGICVIIFKICTFQVHSERLKLIIEKIHVPVDALNRSSDPGVRTIVRECSFYEKLLLRAFWTIGGLLAVALIFLVPVEEGELPIRARYPFEVRSFPLHQVAFFMQVCAVNIGLIAIIGMDSMVIGLYKWMNVQLVVLNSNFEHCRTSKSERAFIVWKTPLEAKESLTNNSWKSETPDIATFVPFNDKEARVSQSNDSFVKRFKTCIKHHQRLIGGVDELNDLFSSSMSVQLFASFSMICLTGFQAVLGAKNLSSLMKFGVYLGAAFSQLLNWCWTGNSLMYQSASLSTSQWLSGWEDHHTPEVVPLLMISLMRSKRPLMLKAGKFYTMSMQTFIAILRNSYSFFALLTEMTNA